MTKEQIIEKVKNALRLSTTNPSIVGEVSDVVNECLEDLKRSGSPIDLDDPLMLKACKCYAKAFFGYDDKSEKYSDSYDLIKKDLATRSGYQKNG